MEHDGISIVFIGRTEIVENPEVTDWKSVTSFLRLTRDVAAPGKLEAGKHTFEFAFENVSKEHESYYGRFAVFSPCVCAFTQALRACALARLNAARCCCAGDPLPGPFKRRSGHQGRLLV